MAYFYGLILVFFMLNPAAAAVPTLNTYCGTLSNAQACGTPSQLVGMAQANAATDYCPATGKYLPFTVFFEQYESWITLRATRDGCAPYGPPAPSTIGDFRLQGTSCPANSTQNSAGTCDCTAGHAEEQNQCVPKQDDPCELLATMCSGSQGMSTNFSIPGQKAGISFTCMAPPAIGTDNPLPGCSNGCMAQVGGFTTAFQSDSGSWMTQGTAKFVGSTCVPSVINDLNAQADPEYQPDPDPKTTEQPNSSCPNGFPGTVNGVTVCVPPKASSGTTELETKDNGDGTKTNSKTDVKCANGKCEVTKTSTTTNTSTGGTVHSSSVTTTVDKAAFCSQNKTAGACKDEKGDNEDGNGSFTGNCDSGFQCKGDAITCAIAKKQHQDYCEALKSPEHAAYVAAKATTGKVTGDLEGNQTIDLMQRFTSGADDFIGSGSCPPDRRIALLYGELVIPYSRLCPWLAILGNILVIVSCIAGARIIIGRYS